MKKGCPVCIDENTITFSENFLRSEYNAKLDKAEAVGATWLYKCADCNSDFYKEKSMYHKLTESSKQVLIAFFKRDLVLNKMFKDQASQIGITENYNGDKLIPAKIELNNGVVHEIARIQLSKNPPMEFDFDSFESIVYMDEVKSISSSDFALSKEIREESKNADELRMGFYPTVLKTTDNRKVVINSLALFFDSHPIKGSDLELANETFDFTNDQYIYEALLKEVLVIGRE